MTGKCAHSNKAFFAPVHTEGLSGVLSNQLRLFTCVIWMGERRNRKLSVEACI